MSKITNLIFKNQSHYVTSGYGYRKIINTKGGATSRFHNGTDYGTMGKKLAQYAIEQGEVLSCGTDKLGGKFVWVKYPRINVKMLHYHLYSVNCKKGSKVSKGTLLGYTGMSGKATGIHLHLSIVDLSTGKYIDPEKEILIKRYGLDGNDEITQKEIAKELGISRSYVSRIEKRATIKILKEFIKNKNN